MLRHTLSAHGAARRIDKINQRRESRGNLRPQCHALDAAPLALKVQARQGIAMASPSVPKIFSRHRRTARDERAAALRQRSETAAWLLDEMRQDLAERIAFMRLEPTRPLEIGAGSTTAFDEVEPIPGGPYDLITSIARLDTINDLPGALIHLRNALAPGGVMIAQLVGAGSLPMLRQVMFAADGDRPAARIHPQVDNRAATALLERAGFTRQVVDSATLKASYRSLDRLIADLREQALTSVLLSPAPYVGKAGLARAREAFESLKDSEGRVTETFEILTLTGWR